MSGFSSSWRTAHVHWPRHSIGIFGVDNNFAACTRIPESGNYGVNAR